VERGLGSSGDFARESILGRTRGIENLFRKPELLPEDSLEGKIRDVDDIDA
jgi:hypothetical protein